MPHDSSTFRFITSLQLRITESSLYLGIIWALKRLLTEHGHTFSGTTWDLWRFAAIMSPYVRAAFSAFAR